MAMRGSHAEDRVKPPGEESSVGPVPRGESVLAGPLSQEPLTPQTVPCTQRFRAAYSNGRKGGKNLKCLSVDEQTNHGLCVQ